jgi:hypothetical protein
MRYTLGMSCGKGSTDCGSGLEWGCFWRGKHWTYEQARSDHDEPGEPNWQAGPRRLAELSCDGDGAGEEGDDDADDGVDITEGEIMFGKTSAMAKVARGEALTGRS